MGPRPYETAEKLGESLSFTADLPAFAPIGRRYAEVEDARLNFVYSQEMIDYWTEYVDAVQHATAEAIAGRRPWPEIVAEMSERYPEEFPPSLERVPPRVWYERVTPEGWKYYLEWLAQNARFFLLAKQLQGGKAGERNDSYANNVRAERAKLLPMGRYKFDCGHRAKPTENQKILFDRLESDQNEIFQEVADALREFYASCRESESELSDRYVQILFPRAASEDIPLDRCRIQSFLLHPSVDQIALGVDSMFDWSDQHGCAVLVSDGKVTNWGGVDLLFPIYDELSDDEDAEIKCARSTTGGPDN